MIIYHNTKKELFPENYKPLPVLHGQNADSLRELYENLQNALYNSFIYGSDLLTVALDNDIRKVKRYLKMTEKKEKNNAF